MLMSQVMASNRAEIARSVLPVVPPTTTQDLISLKLHDEECYIVPTIRKGTREKQRILQERLAKAEAMLAAAGVNLDTQIISIDLFPATTDNASTIQNLNAPGAPMVANLPGGSPRMQSVNTGLDKVSEQAFTSTFSLEFASSAQPVESAQTMQGVESHGIDQEPMTVELENLNNMSGYVATVESSLPSDAYPTRHEDDLAERQKGRASTSPDTVRPAF